MSSYTLNGFDYFSTLDSEVENSLPSSLQIEGSPSSESTLFRLLLGTLNFKYSDYENVFVQNVSYTKIRDIFEDNLNPDPIRAWLESEFGVLDLEFYFKKNRKNKVLFDELLSEFSLYFVCKQKGNFTSAFLHLYRALEYMSYSFPITYASRVTGFYSSYDTFKNFFVSKDQGQLKFFREFIMAFFDKGILVSRTAIDTFVGDELYDKYKIKIIRKLCQEFDYHDDGSVVKIEYKNLLDFMVNLRNRYFHFQYDRGENISNINFNGELFFEALNDKFANWLSLIYLEILTQGVYKYNLMPTN